MNIAELLVSAARTAPEAIAVVGPDATVTYREIDRFASQAACLLRHLGVRPRDRIGVYAPKGVRPLVFMQAALRIGAVYVPIDPKSPPARAAEAFAECGASAIVAPAAALREILASPALQPRVLGIALDDEVRGLPCWADVRDNASREDAMSAMLPAGDDELAYVLYTSGSTGPMKGVCISHGNAFAFVKWAVEATGAGPDDRFANHAPYNFDLSVFDIYGAFLARATLVICPEEASYLGARLVAFCRAHAISVWYSVPTALALMLRTGSFDSASLPSLRTIIFAGEVFPIKGVRALRHAFPRARLFNFYGPTETNVCTAHEVADVPETRLSPVPIGRASCGNDVWAATADGRRAGAGEEGELLVDGPTVARGYWGRPFQPGLPYRTGDLVRVVEEGLFEYIGRFDRMVKVRGCRIELGEVEAALLSHPAIEEAAVLVHGEGPDARLVAFLAAAPGVATPSALEIRMHCASRLPPYMQIAEAQVVPRLPRTPNGKVDFARLRLAGPAAAPAAPPAATQATAPVS